MLTFLQIFADFRELICGHNALNVIMHMSTAHCTHNDGINISSFDKWIIPNPDAGNFGLRLCAEGSAKAAAEALQPPDSGRGAAHPVGNRQMSRLFILSRKSNSWLQVPVEVLRCRQDAGEGWAGHLENSSEGSKTISLNCSR